ncbi:MAG TPA: VanZ family protein [Chthoniobacterales bacterium]
MANKLRRFFSPPVQDWTLFGLWALAICILSSMSAQDLSDVPEGLLHQDKVNHAIAFAAGSLLLARALHRNTRLRGLRLFFAAVGGIALFGACDELHQLFTPGRSGGDIYDWAADVTGGTIAATLFVIFYGRPRSERTDFSGSPGANLGATRGNREA